MQSKETFVCNKPRKPCQHPHMLPVCVQTFSLLVLEVFFPAVYTPRRFRAELQQRSSDAKVLWIPLSPPLPFLGAASMFGSPTSLGSFLMSSRQMKENAKHTIPDADRTALQVWLWTSTVTTMGPTLPARFMLQDRIAHHVPN